MTGALTGPLAGALGADSGRHTRYSHTAVTQPTASARTTATTTAPLPAALPAAVPAALRILLGMGCTVPATRVAQVSPRACTRCGVRRNAGCLSVGLVARP